MQLEYLRHVVTYLTGYFELYMSHLTLLAPVVFNCKDIFVIQYINYVLQISLVILMLSIC